MASYWELLRHPLWQEKRLRIMERARFACEECGGKDVTLNVHHGYYQKGKKPWEYPDDSLKCLCEDCHEISESLKREFLGLFAMLPHCDQREMIGYVAAELALAGKWECETRGCDVIVGAMKSIVANVVDKTNYDVIQFGPHSQKVGMFDGDDDRKSSRPMQITKEAIRNEQSEVKKIIAYQLICDSLDDILPSDGGETLDGYKRRLVAKFSGQCDPGEWSWV